MPQSYGSQRRERGNRSQGFAIPMPAELVIKNEDSQAEEFDSSALKAEKVIAASQTATIKLRPLKAGRYDFTGEYHEETAKGVVIAE